MDELKKTLQAMVELMSNPDIDWEHTYDLLFTLAESMPTIQYYDPDCGYHDDAIAYYKAAMGAYGALIGMTAYSAPIAEKQVWGEERCTAQADW